MRVAGVVVCSRGSAEPASCPSRTIQVVSVVSLTAVGTVGGVGIGRRRPYVVRIVILLTCADTLPRTERCTAHAGVATPVSRRIVILLLNNSTKKTPFGF